MFDVYLFIDYTDHGYRQAMHMSAVSAETVQTFTATEGTVFMVVPAGTLDAQALKGIEAALNAPVNA